jgi:hypothetical protein
LAPKTETQLAEIVHQTYTVLCDMLGPVAADNLLHKAISHCEQLPSAKWFAPRRFL